MKIILTSFSAARLIPLVVSGDEVAHHLTGVGAHLGEPGIEEQLLAISDKPLRMLLRGMPRCDVGRDVGHGAVGIDPGM